MIVAWRSGSQQGVSRLGTISLGGLFLNTPTPPAEGAMLELLFEIAKGGEVRAKAVVRSSIAGKGMGVKFVHMQSEHRANLTQFLKTQLAAGNMDADPCSKFPKTDATASDPAVSAGAAASESGAASSEAASNNAHEASRTGENPTQGERCTAEEQTAQEKKTPQNEELTEEELKRFVALSEKSNHYQLLGVSTDSGKNEIKEAFYLLARKFHPDHHMRKPEWALTLQQLMGAMTEAYNVLSDENKRGIYDRKLILSNTRTQAEETLEECTKLAANAERDQNIEGAIFWWRKCVNIAPEVAKYRVSLAANLANVAHHRREAAEHFQKAIELDQWNINAHLQFGHLYEVMQLPWRAEKLYSKVLEIDPDHALARQRLKRMEAKEQKKTAPRMARLFSKK
jgi:tetratricopeptide (TPR) repeat protein